MNDIISAIIVALSNVVKKYPPLLSEVIIANNGTDPFFSLIGCLISLRAQDRVTIHVCHALFKEIQNPSMLASYDIKKLEAIVYKSGYYKAKAKILQSVAKELLERFDGKVPSTYKELTSIKGVGPKTANLVRAVAFGSPAICVDTHVHRISNRLGIIKTDTPEQSQIALELLLPSLVWSRWNELLVKLGQNICHPVSPKCSQCPIARYCKKNGVRRSR